MDHKRIEGEPFVISEDKERGVRVVGWYEVGDDRLHYQTQQEIPEEFFKQTNELEAQWSRNTKVTTHYEQFAKIPGLLRDQWQQELGDWTRDEDAMKALKRRLNDSDYRKLRTGGGNL